jgi:hypothetical protein
MDMTRRATAIVVLVIFFGGLSSAWAFVVTDPATTARNVVTAVLKSRLLETLTEQGDRIRRMARRLSVFTNLDKYAIPDVPRWRVYRFQDVHLYANPYSEALNYGDPEGIAYAEIARVRSAIGRQLSTLPPAAAAAIAAQLATLDLTDSAIIAGTDQNGRLRPQGKREMRAIDALERHVVDPSQTQSATAVLDKISAAVLIEARQKQSRLQFLTAFVEQLIVDNKRTRDTEAAAMNMQLGRLRSIDDESGGGFLDGAGDALRTWRQP